MAAVDYFLKIDGIEGESKDAKHKGEIDIESFSFGVSQSGTMAFGGGGGGGKASFQDFHIVKKPDKSSPKLWLACASGEHIKKAELVCRKAGGKQEEYMKITLTDLMVTSYQAGIQAGAEVPSEQVSINYAKIEQEYREQKADGSLGPFVKAGYDVKANKKI